MVVLLMACCTFTVLFFVLFFCLYFVYCMIVLFVDNLFFYLGGQSVSCKASLAALRLYGYVCDIVVMMLLSENKYDDDDDVHIERWLKYVVHTDQ